MDTQPTAESLLTIVHDVARELHPHRAATALPRLDQRLSEELGFDSLGQAELVQRLEQAFTVRLPDHVLSAVESPRDLLRAVMGAAPAAAGMSPPAVHEVALVEAEAPPDHAETLLDMLDWQVQHHDSRPYVLLYGDDDTPEEITFGKLRHGAAEIAAGLQAKELQQGDTVAIMLPTCAEYLYTFMGVLMAGGIPVPIYPPVRPNQIEDHLRRHMGILNNAQTRAMITVSEARAVALLLRAQVPSLREIATPGELRKYGDAPRTPPLRSSDIAFLQYTSGSTGTPKGVVLTHANLLANIRARGEAGRVDSTDVFVSWLPLYHDMGLIGAVFGSMYHASVLVLMSPLAFLNRPERWLWAVHRHRGTISPAPNFAYELCLRRISEERLEGLDLGSWRFAPNGAEPVSVETVRQFHERFEPYGLRPGTVAPVYGLAESSVGLAFSPPGRTALSDLVRREPLMRNGRAEPAQPDDPDTIRIVACGQPLPRHEVRIVDERGRELGERQEGRLQFRGPSTTSGYYRNPEETQKLFDGEWVNSGDRAYIAEGDIYLTGREKDVIIRAGRNLYPYQLEEAVGNLEGIRKGCVAVFGTRDERSGTERLVVLAETRESEEAVRERLREEIKVLTMNLVGADPEEVLLAPPQTVLKTSSGKLRRPATRELYERGGVGRAQRGMWWQLARLALAGVGPQIRRWLRQVSNYVYAGRWWWALGVVSILTWPSVVLIPLSGWGRAVTRGGSRGFFRLAGLPLRVSGRDRLPRGRPCVYVANHSSYMDSLVLFAVLPGRLHFVAKKEMAGQFFAGPFLRRIGTEFVERIDKQRGLEDARRVSGAAQAGHSLGFFPEGTFTRMPGLTPFHMGAFVAAAEAGLPVVPVAIRGTRSVLRDGSWFPRWGRIAVRIGEPIAPQGSDWNAAISLRNAAREAVLQECGEPDLAPQAE